MKRVVSSSCIAAMLSFGIAAYAQTTGQTPTQPASPAGSQRMEQGRQSGDRSQTEQQITLIGCIQREADYRQATQGGRGGTMGTGLGVGNEFVLINASMGSGAGSETAGHPTHPTGTTAGTTTGTTAGTTTGTTAGTTSGTASAGTTGSATGTTGSATGTMTGRTSTGTAATGTTGADVSMASGGTAYSLTGNREKELESLVGQRVEIIGTIEGGAGRSGAAGGAYGGSTGGTTGTGSTTGSTAAGTTSGTTAGTTSGTTSAGTTGTTSGTTAGGTTSGTTSPGSSASAGRSVGSLQQVNVVSFRAVGGSCPQQ